VVVMRQDFPFSRLREKVAEGRMRVLVQPATIYPVSAKRPPESILVQVHPHPRFAHLLPQAGEGEKL